MDSRSSALMALGSIAEAAREGEPLRVSAMYAGGPEDRMTAYFRGIGRLRVPDRPIAFATYDPAFSAYCLGGRPDPQVPLAFLPRPIFFASADLVAA
jgi:hypothetical protein